MTLRPLDKNHMVDWESGFIVQVTLREAVESTHLRQIAVDDFEMIKELRGRSSEPLEHVDLVKSNGYVWDGGKGLVKLHAGHRIAIRNDSFQFWLLFPPSGTRGGFDYFEFHSDTLQSSAKFYVGRL